MAPSESPRTANMRDTEPRLLFPRPKRGNGTGKLSGLCAKVGKMARPRLSENQTIAECAAIALHTTYAVWHSIGFSVQC